jgi:hypothetical protein
MKANEIKLASMEEFKALPAERKCQEVIKGIFLTSFITATAGMERAKCIEDAKVALRRIVEIDHDIFGVSYANSIKEMKQITSSSVECEFISKVPTVEEWNKEDLKF